MTESQLISLKHAIAIINGAIAEQRPADNSWDCPVISFARRFLAITGISVDFSCEELYDLYTEIAATGKLPPMRKSIFLRRLPVAMASVFNIKKSHNLVRNGSRVRGFQGIIYKVDDTYTAPEL